MQNEYQSAAEWCAKNGVKGRIGDSLPRLLSSSVMDAINDDPEAFEQIVNDYAYGIATPWNTP